MEFFKSLDPRQQKLIKYGAITVAALVLLAIISGTGSGPVIKPFGVRSGTMMVAPSAGGNVIFDYAVESQGGSSKGMMLSTRNMMPVPPQYGGTTGDDAEAFEVTDYSATIESRDAAKTCAAVADLKVKSYVIFENSNSYDRGCSHTFKVKRENVPEVLAAIKDLEPRDLSENVQTIKQQITDYTSQIDILQKKLAAIDQTLKTALAAYDEITAIATRSQDAGSLAKIIDSKVGIIERLTQERININSQLEYLARSRGNEIDRIDYTYFRVSVFENRYFDGKSISDSWKEALRQFVYNVNRIIQGITLGLIGFILILAQYIVYIFILLLLAKYGWRFVRGFWNK
jgi:hypothetical protein